MADYDSNKQAHELNVIDSTIDGNSLIVAQDVVGNPLGIAKPASIVHATTIDDIQDGTTSKKISAAEKTSYDGHLIDDANPHNTTKAQVGLSEANNTSDIDKPVSTAQQAAIDSHANLTTNPHSVTKAQVGLPEANNTSDIDKPVSTAQQAALDLKANANETVNLTGNQIIDGSKTFNSSPQVTTSGVGTDNANAASTAFVQQEIQDQTVRLTDNQSIGGVKTFQSSPTVPALPVGTDNTKAANTGFVQNEIEDLGFRGNEAIPLPPGTTAQRPSVPVEGMIRYNIDIDSFEGYAAGIWASVGGGASGAPQNPVFYENDTNVTGSYTITAGKNAMSAGPITVDAGVSVTVPDGSVWTIV